MKKLLVIFLVLAFVAPAMAEDRLSLSGSVRVRAWSYDNWNLDTDDTTGNNEFWDQRFRMGAIVSPADGVKGVLRFDFAEEWWGSNNWNGSRYNAGVSTGFGDVSSSSAGEFQVDRAYIDVTKGMVQVKAGQQYIGLGNNFAYDNQATGLQVVIKTPLVIRLGFVKIDEDPTGSFGTLTDLSDEEGLEDTDHWLLDLGYKTDAFSVNAFYVAQTDGTDAENEPSMFGLMGKFGIGPVDIFAEFNSFGGDTAAGMDYVGNQLVVDAGMKMSDALKLGVQFVYSDGTDDPSEMKTVRMPNGFFGSVYYANYGAFAPDAPNALGVGDVMDPRGTESGAIGGAVYCSFKPIDVLTLAGNVVYLTGSEDAPGMFDSGYMIGINAEWMMVQNCTLAAGYTFIDADIVDAETDSGSALVARLQITF